MRPWTFLVGLQLRVRARPTDVHDVPPYRGCIVTRRQASFHASLNLPDSLADSLKVATN